MGAVLQAPRAALMALLELTGNPYIILPAMLVIVVANMTASQVFGLRSVLLMQMQTLGLESRQNPLSMALNRASVASVMVRAFKRVTRHINIDEARELITEKPDWLLVDDEGKLVFILSTRDLERHLLNEQVDTIDLASIPATRMGVTGVFLQATLREALDALDNSGVQALYVNRIMSSTIDSPGGIITREHIESCYQSQALARRA